MPKQPDVSEPIVHKISNFALVLPKPLEKLVLCVNHGLTVEIEKGITVSTSINQVTCPKCWDLWRQRFYV